MSISLTRRGLEAWGVGAEVKSRSSLLLSLARRGLEARGAGAEGRDADVDGIIMGNFGAGVGEDVCGDFGAGVGEDVCGDFGAGVGADAGPTSGGFCGGAGVSKNIASQSCGKAIIVRLLGKKRMESSLCMGSFAWPPAFRLQEFNSLKAGHSALHALQLISTSGSSSRHTFSVITFSPAALG